MSLFLSFPLLEICQYTDVFKENRSLFHCFIFYCFSVVFNFTNFYSWFIISFEFILPFSFLASWGGSLGYWFKTHTPLRKTKAWGCGPCRCILLSWDSSKKDEGVDEDFSLWTIGTMVEFQFYFFTLTSSELL